MNNSVYEKASIEFNLPLEVIKEIYESYYKFIKNKIEEVSYTDISEEEFSKLRTSFNIPSIGKLYSSYDRIISMRKKFNYINDKSKKD